MSAAPNTARKIQPDDDDAFRVSNRQEAGAKKDDDTFDPVERDFYARGLKEENDGQNDSEREPDEDTPEKRERRGIGEAIMGFFGMKRKETAEAIDGLNKIEKGEVGETPAKLAAEEKNKLEQLKERVYNASNKMDIVDLRKAGSRSAQREALYWMYEGWVEKQKKSGNNELSDEVNAIYRKLGQTKGAEYKKSGAYNTLTEDENAMLKEAEGRNITDDDVRAMINGEKPWHIGAYERAREMLAQPVDELAERRKAMKDKTSGGATAAAVGIAGIAGGAAVAAIFSGANRDKGGTTPGSSIEIDNKQTTEDEHAKLKALEEKADEIQARLDELEDEGQILIEANNFADSDSQEQKIQKLTDNLDIILEYSMLADTDIKPDVDVKTYVMMGKNELSKFDNIKNEKERLKAKLAFLQKRHQMAYDALKKLRNKAQDERDNTANEKKTIEEKLRREAFANVDKILLDKIESLTTEAQLDEFLHTSDADEIRLILAGEGIDAAKLKNLSDGDVSDIYTAVLVAVEERHTEIRKERLIAKIDKMLMSKISLAKSEADINAFKDTTNPEKIRKILITQGVFTDDIRDLSDYEIADIYQNALVAVDAWRERSTGVEKLTAEERLQKKLEEAAADADEAEKAAKAARNKFTPGAEEGDIHAIGRAEYEKPTPEEIERIMNEAHNLIEGMDAKLATRDRKELREAVEEIKPKTSPKKLREHLEEKVGITAYEAAALSDEDLIILKDELVEKIEAFLKTPEVVKPPEVIIAGAKEKLAERRKIGITETETATVVQLEGMIRKAEAKLGDIATQSTDRKEIIEGLIGLDALPSSGLDSITDEQLKELARERVTDLEAIRDAARARLAELNKPPISSEPTPAKTPTSAKPRVRVMATAVPIEPTEPKPTTGPEAVFKKAEAALSLIKEETIGEIAKANERDLVGAVRKAEAKMRDIKADLADRKTTIGGLEGLKVLSRKELGNLSEETLKKLAQKRIDDLEAIRTEAEKRLSALRGKTEPTTTTITEPKPTTTLDQTPRQEQRRGIREEAWKKINATLKKREAVLSESEDPKDIAYMEKVISEAGTFASADDIRKQFAESGLLAGSQANSLGDAETMSLRDELAASTRRALEAAKKKSSVLQNSAPDKQGGKNVEVEKEKDRAEAISKVRAAIETARQAILTNVIETDGLGHENNIEEWRKKLAESTSLLEVIDDLSGQEVDVDETEGAVLTKSDLASLRKETDIMLQGLTRKTVETETAKEKLLSKDQYKKLTKINKALPSGLAKDETTPEQFAAMEIVYDLYEEHLKSEPNIGKRIKLKEKYLADIKAELAKLKS